MGHLYAIVQAHIDKYGVREAELARRIGTQPQTVNSWKKRGVRAVPSRHLMANLAEVTGRPYVEVLRAALIDAGLLDVDEAGPLTTSPAAPGGNPQSAAN